VSAPGRLPIRSKIFCAGSRHVKHGPDAERVVALEHDLDRLAEQAVELELAEPHQTLLDVDPLDALALGRDRPQRALDRHRAVLELLQLAVGVDDRRQGGFRGGELAVVRRLSRDFFDGVYRVRVLRARGRGFLCVRFDGGHLPALPSGRGSCHDCHLTQDCD
jgi:hypothetical protein